MSVHTGPNGGNVLAPPLPALPKTAPLQPSATAIPLRKREANRGRDADPGGTRQWLRYPPWERTLQACRAKANGTACLLHIETAAFWYHG